MRSENRCGTQIRQWPLKRRRDSLSLGWSRHHDENFVSLHQNRNCQREGLGWHVRQCLKCSIVHLLNPARYVEFHDAHGARVGKIARRIVERQMPVLSDSQQRNIETVGRQQRCIARAFRFLIFRLATDLMESRGRHGAKNMLLQIASK